MSPSVPRGFLLLSAFLSGLSGLALESLLVSSSGLALGYGGSTAIGLSTWLAAWALGAWALRRRTERAPARLVAVGVCTAVVAPLAVWTVLAAGDALAGSALAAPIAIFCIALIAFLQGAFLPLLAHGAARVGPLFAANLLGSLLGAWSVADIAAGAFGRLPASCFGSAAALVAGIVGARALKQVHVPTLVPTSATAPAATLPWISAALVIGLGAAWMSAGEWVLLRLGVLWLGGMQNALNSVLCASLLALAIGAALLPPLFARTTRGVAFLLVVCAVASLWPFVASPALRAVGDAPLFVRALVLCGPALLPFGALVPVVHAATDTTRESGERLGGLLLHEVWGAALGIPVVHLLVVPHFGLPGAIGAGLVAGAFALLALVRTAPGIAGVGFFALAYAMHQVAHLDSPALASPPLSNPALSVLTLREDRDFAVAVVDDGMLGERTLLTDGFRAAGTGRDYRYMEALGHLPILVHASPRSVAVLALGTGTTVGAVALHPAVEHIDVLEISRAVVDAAPLFAAKNHGVLDEGLPEQLREENPRARIGVLLGDGRASLARADAAYDVITMEPLLPDSPFAVYLYTREFYAIAKRALREGGLVCQWVPPHALEPETFDALLDAFASSFEWSSAWLFGTQVVLLGAEREPAAFPGRFPPQSPAVSDGGLATALSSLGLAGESELLLRWCGSIAAFRGTTRPLTDADPWIVYRPRRAGAQLLADLPNNLARLRALPHELPAGWSSARTTGLDARLAGARDLRLAREAHAWIEAALRGVAAPSGAVADYEAALARARLALSGDPELARFEGEIQFLESLRRGVQILQVSAGRDGGEMALEPLITAAERRPERADVHLYTAVALERIGSPAAEKALARALELCPGLASTSEGARARALGLSDAAWSHALARDAARTRNGR